MNKKLLVLALAGAFVAPAAMADVTISGTINTGPQIGSVTDATATGQSNAVASSNGAKGYSQMGLTSNYSNVNLNSTEDIGDGNKVVFNAQLDFSNTGTTVHDNGTGGNLRQRNTFIGFEGGWGSVRMGINEHIYERYMYSSDVLDGAAGIGGNLQMLGSPGYGVVFDANSQGSCTASAGCAGFYRRTSNSIWYDSPDINGFTFGIAQTLNAYQSAASGTGGTKPTITSLGAQFKPADLPFFLNIAFERHKDMFGLNVITGVGGASGSTDTGLQIGGGFTFGDASVYLRFESLKYKSDGLANTAVQEYKRDATWLGAKYNLSTGYIGLQIGIANDGKVQCGSAFTGACNANNSGATVVSGGYAHNLSKQTQLLFFFNILNNSDLARYYPIGPRAAGAVGPGSDGRALAFLIKHSF